MPETRKPKGMAGEQNNYLRVRVPGDLKDAFEGKCNARGTAMSKVVRNLLEAYCSADDRDPLIAPLVVMSQKKPAKKKS